MWTKKKKSSPGGIDVVPNVLEGIKKIYNEKLKPGIISPIIRKLHCILS